LIVIMTVVGINVITVPADSGDALARSFPARPARRRTRAASRGSIR
jgi:hypothetical protein